MPRVLVLIVGLFAILAIPAGTLAQDTAEGTPVPAAATSQFEIAPEPGDDPATTASGYFIYELAPGEEAAGSVRVLNPGDEPVTIEFAAVDSRTAQRGRSAFSDAEATPVAAGAWVDLDESRISLDPGEEAVAGFTVSPPEGTGPGQYLAGLAAFVPAEDDRATNAGENGVGASVTMQTRFVIGVQVDVPGEWTPAMTITGASVLEQPSGARLGIALRNDGNVFLKPRGRVTLTDAKGSEILHQPIEMGAFLAGTEVTYPISWPGVPVSGEYGVEVELNYAGDHVARYSGAFTIRDDAPVMVPEPEQAEPVEQVAQTEKAEPVPVSAPVSAPAAPAPGSMWNPYLIAGLVGLIGIPLAAVLLRTRQPRW